jgi:4'-phosphopantetheinyl transferase EntD
MTRARTVWRSPSWRLGLAATDAPVDGGPLVAEEEALVASAGPARVAEFAAGRQCARLALASLDPSLSRVPVLADAYGAPSWPPGFVGSITHCPGWTGAVAARSARSVRPAGRLGDVLGRGVRGIGLDAEPVAPLPEGVLDVVASGAEQEALAGLEDVRPGIPWDRLLFSAKEATYKAWYPLTGVVVGHDALRVELSSAGSFTGVASGEDAAGTASTVTVRGRWAVGPHVLVTLCVAG